MSASASSLAPPSALDPATIPLAGRTTFIEASAGTGKTHALATLYLRLLIEHDLRPADILVVTFTQAATAELRDRIRNRIREALAGDPGPGEASLRRALQQFDEAGIFTIHGFCQRTLQESAFESGLAFEAELVEKPETLQRTLAHDLWMRLLEEEDDALREWLTAGAGRRRWTFEPDALFALMREHLGADDTMPVWPALPKAEAAGVGDDPARIAAAVDAAWLRVAELWTTRREAIAALWLDDAIGFNRNKFRTDTIRKRWIPELDALARDVLAATTAAERVGLARPADFEKWTNSGLAAGMKQKFAPPSDPFFDACSALAELLPALDASFDARALALRRRFVEAVREADRRRRGEEHVLFFDDLLSQLRGALAAPGGEALGAALRARYRFALIDEFQDTDAVQYEIFRRVWNDEAARAAGGGLVLIGDPKQAIYSFRGADIHTYLAARADAAGGVHTLGVNHRSEPAVVAAVNAVFGASPDPFAEPAIGFHPVVAADRERPKWSAEERYTAGLRVALFSSEETGGEAPGEAESDAESREASREEAEAESKGSVALRFARTAWMQAVARDIAELLESGATIGDRRIQPSDIAVLARRRSELDAVRRALDALGIPSVSRGDGNVFDSREAWELSSVLAAWLHPGDFRRLRAALSSGAHGWDATALAALDDDSPELVEIAERFAHYGRLWSQSGLARAFETWRTREGVSERLLALPDGDRRSTNWLHLAELLARVASERGASRGGLVAWLDQAIADEASRQGLESEATLLRLERDDEAVQLVTLHASKGLEYEVVYLPCLWETFESRESVGKSESDSGRRAPVRYADPEANGRRSLDLGVLGPEYAVHLALEKAQMRAEQQRLLYVGLTRAKRHCVVFWGRAGPAWARSPLTRLLFPDAVAAGGDDPKRVDDAIKAKSDADFRAAWRAIAEAAPRGSVLIEEAALGARGPWRPAARDDVDFEFEPPPPLALGASTTTSFSALVRGAQRRSAVLAGPLATGRDLDAEVDDRPHDEDEGSDLAADLHSFPRGAEAGTLLHEVLERCDFTAIDESAVSQLAGQWLAQSGLDRSLAPTVVEVVRSVARTPLAPGTFRLADVAPGQLRPELEFTLAAPGDTSGRGFSTAPGGAQGRGFSAAALADVLADAPAGSPLARYAERARTLAWPQLAGYLRGFIDAVFCDGERYFVVDYKSNHLGAHQADYLPERLVQPMIDHDYVLQYLLYVVAVDRHLASRIVGYDYARHFGGAYYLFLRGMSERHAPGCGIFFDRPDPETVRRVSALLGGPGEGGR